MSKRKGLWGASSSRSVPVDDTHSNNRASLDFLRVGTYTDAIGNKWCGRKRQFVNKRILMHDTTGPVSHIFTGEASQRAPRGVIDDQCNRLRLPWEDLLDKRREQEMYCRWHGLRVPKTRSTKVWASASPSTSKVIKALEREIEQMQRRLDRYHFTEHAKIECVDPTR